MNLANEQDISEKTFKCLPLDAVLPVRTMRDLNSVLRNYPAIAKEFAALCAKHAQIYNNKLAETALKYVQRAKNCAAEDTYNISEYSIMAVKCSLHAAISGNVNCKNSDKRKEVIRLVETGTIWQMRMLSDLIRDRIHNA